MKKLVKLLRDPALFFQDAARNRRAATRTGTPTYVVGFSTWKQYMRKFFPDRNLTFLPREISEHEFNLVWSKKILSDRNAEIFIWGFKAPPYILQFIKKNNVKVMFVEDGFVRSVQLGASKAPPMSLCLDSRTPYFNAREASDLELMLLKHDFAADSALLKRADKAIELLLTSGVSKYNNSARVDVMRLYGPKKGKRVLVIGQVEDDASIEFGCEQGITNNELVRLAAKENPGAQIIYKPHPDVLAGHRDMRSNPEDVAGLAVLLREKLPLAQAFETIDHVYTITSLAGFEALLRGIKVTTLGAPFYAGWGLTDDRQPTPRRQRKLALRELFAGAYLLYPRYFDPASGEERQLEDIIAVVASVAQLAASDSPALSDSANSQTEATPVRIEEVEETGLIPTYLVGNDLPYRRLLGKWFDERSFTHIPTDTTEVQFLANFKKIIDGQPRAEFFISGDNVAPYLRKYIKVSGKLVSYLSDGYLRSVGKIAKGGPPYSLLLDRRAPYYDARRPSDLEEILSNYDFEADTALMARAALLKADLLQSGLSKFNHGVPVEDLELLYGVKDRVRVLVLGQVESTAAFKMSNPRGHTNNDLVTIAAMENPGAQIIFKPHTDVLNNFRTTVSNPSNIAHLCQVLEHDLPLAQALETVDHVYSISSLGGFEALLRGIKTTTLGVPFYAGWGLGDDRHVLGRRRRDLSVEQVFAAAYILYPIYVDPLYKTQISIEQAIVRLTESVGSVASDEDTASLMDDESPARDSLAPIPTYVVGDLDYKALFVSWFPDRKFTYIPGKTTNDQFVEKYKKSLDASADAEFFVLGENTETFLRRYMNASGKKVTHLNEGFLRSIELGEKASPYSLLLDDLSPCYDSRQPTRLEELLKKYDFDGDFALMVRAENLLNKLIHSGLSKYNHAKHIPDVEVVYGVKNKPRVLVLGQVEGAASVKLANPRNYSNNDLVMIAAKENPHAQIIFKPHPDVINKIATTPSSTADVMHLCQVLDIDLPLARALDSVDHVYSISSLGGFEALLRGIKTTTLGLPFYAGWGLGDDRQLLDRRQRKLSVQQVFAAAYILYPVYVDPLYKMQIQPEEALERLDEVRREQVSGVYSAAMVKVTKPARRELWDSFVKYGAWDDETKPVAFAFSFTQWRFAQIAAYFPEYRLAFHAVAPGDREKVGLKPVIEVFDSVPRKIFIVLGKKDPPGMQDYVQQSETDVIRVEDGFIRGVGLGAELSPPLSLALDRTGMYFDARTPSDLEEILNKFDFDAHPELLVEARQCIDRIIASKATKYNLSGNVAIEELYGEKKKRRILVIGQVENDASIQFGCNRIIDNNGLVMLASLENPDAEIIYKPHPDVIRGNRRYFSNPKDVENVAKVIYEPIGIHHALETIDHVYTITSLAGFESLLRGIPVTTFGAPFYSGWGLTDARQSTPRRKRQLTIEQVFAGAYMIYMKYRHPITSELCDLRQALDLLDWMKETKSVLAPKFTSDPEIAKQHFRIFQRRVRDRQFDSAAEEISSAIKLDPENYAYPLARANLLLTRGELSERTKNDLLESVNLAGKKTIGPLRALAGFIWKNEGVTQELLQTINLILSSGAEIDVKLMLWIAAIYADAGFIENAAELYVEAMNKDATIASKQRYLFLLHHVSLIYPEKVENLERVRFAYNTMLSAQGEFEKICRSGKRIAVVGNSPCELGRGMGDAIDKHDIVIRFNNFSTAYPFVADYGSKTNIWVKTGLFETVHRRNGVDFDLIIQSASHLPVASPNGVDVMWSAIADGNIMEFIPLKLKYDLVKKLQATPSAGLLILSWIYSINGPLSRDSVFGFSFIDQQAGSHTSYHSAPDNGTYKHNWEAEREIFDTLFEN